MLYPTCANLSNQVHRARREHIKALTMPFAPVIAVVAPEQARVLHELTLEVLGRQLVGDRPDRFEPRAIKRRPKPHKLLQKPRELARNELLGLRS